MTGDEPLDDLIQRADLDGLVRLVDDRGATRDWEGLLRLRDRARAAVETGRQLWPAAVLAEYRLALLAPPPAAVDALAADAGRFTIGPLTEVIAQHHRWDDLEPHLRSRAADVGARAVYVAHERSLRRDDIDPGQLTPYPPAIEIPVDIRPWEPDWPLATYHDDHGDFDSPPRPTGGDLIEPPGANGNATDVVDDPDVTDAVGHLVAAWGAGRPTVVAVEGDPPAALAALGVRRARLAPLDATTALAWLGWAGASGGRHGRRRGAAAGRDAAWWVLGAIGDLHDTWPPTDAQVEDLLADLRWWWWDALDPPLDAEGGWSLRLVVHDGSIGTSWALRAHDTA